MNFKDPKDPAESVVLEFDFSSELTAISSATVAVSLAAGADPLIAHVTSGVLDGTHQVSGRTVLQRFRNGVPGARYKFRAVATDGQDTIVRIGIAAVKTA